MTRFFGFAVADSMFPSECSLSKRPLDPTTQKEAIESATSCLNPSHTATISAMKVRYGLNLQIPEKAPQVSLKPGDAVIVAGVRGLPRLDATRHEYTEDEIAKATFAFSEYRVS